MADFNQFLKMYTRLSLGKIDDAYEGRLTRTTPAPSTRLKVGVWKLKFVYYMLI